jgi:hypothetical protein
VFDSAEFFWSERVSTEPRWTQPAPYFLKVYGRWWRIATY